MRERLITILTHLSKPAIAIGGSLAAGIALVGFAWYAASISSPGSYVPVTAGPITEAVTVLGTVKAAHSTDLAFQTSGRVTAILVHVGDHVEAGQTLVALDRSSQAAVIALAKANLEAQQAKLDALAAGTRPEQLAINQNAVAQAKDALISALGAAYTSADDAIHAKADQVFSNPRSSNAVLTVLVPDFVLVNQVQTERAVLDPIFSSWKSTLASSENNPQGAVTVSQADIQTISTFLNDLTTALAETQAGGSLSLATLTGYQTTVNTARINVSTALSALISADTAYTAATGALTLAQAGATANDIAAQKASVDAAQASLDAAEAAASQAVIVAPVSGTITVQNANLGQTAVPGVPLVSMIADGKYQADVQVSEADIAKVKVNDAVETTFAAYPNATFAAMVTTVDPAATMNGGVASYGITVTFLDNDSRLMPGLSANLRIITATKDRALIVPTSAVITDGTQKFVYVKNATGVLRTPVATGIENADGMTEIVSGLVEGDKVLAFGNSAQ